MNAESLFRAILPALLLAFAAHRGYYVRSHGPEKDTVEERQSDPVSRVAGLLGLIGLMAAFLYTLQPGRISWASLPLPLWLRWAGVATALSGFALLQWAQSTLGRSWSDTPRLRRGQALVTRGPYEFIRHPIYTAFLLILGSTLLISANWLVGAAWTGMTALEVMSRISFEERLMLDHFGERYRRYKERTGRLLPRLIR